MTPQTRVIGLAAFVAQLFILPAVSAQAEIEQDYHRFLRANYSANATPVPADGVVIRHDNAEWRFTSGSFRWLEAATDGTTTGVYFEGTGQFSIEIADDIEQGQIARMSEREVSNRFAVPFDRLLLRTADVAQLGFDVPPAGAVSELRAAKERQEHDFVHQWRDTDARIVAARANGDHDYLRVLFSTDEFDWMTYEFEPWRREEITLLRGNRGFSESWLSVDRAEHRSDSGRTGAPDLDGCRLRHVDIVGDLREPGDGGRVGRANIQPRKATLSAKLQFETLVDDLEVLQLVLNPWAEVKAVRDGQGNELTYLRDNIGSRSSSVDKELWDRALRVFLPEPTAAGETLNLEVDYELEVYNYLPGGRGAWYPFEGHSDSLSKHTARFDLMFLDRHEVRAMGREEVWEEVDGGRHGVWVIDEPTFMTTFAFAERGGEQSVEVDGLPKITAFGTKGAATKNKMHNVAADVANSAHYFQQIFQSPLPQDEIWMVSILGGHGQAFDGFLHLAESTFDSETPGASEWFRAHETAHLWWGHLVAWESYRDQWLSEAFASYSALMFIEASMGEKGKDLFDEALQAYADSLNGSLKAATSRFSWFSGNTMNDKHRQRLGPIAVGGRAGTADIPEGYQLQAYVKGPLVLHMLRKMLSAKTGNDEIFLSVLQDFVQTHAGGAANTADFQAALTRKAPGNWTWFFDQWIRGTAIPTYRYSWTTKKGEGGKTIVVLTVKQSDVPDGFQMPVPVKVDFGGGKGGQIVVPVRQAEETFEIPLPRKPKKIELNPGHAVLAKVIKD